VILLKIKAFYIVYIFCFLSFSSWSEDFKLLINTDVDSMGESIYLGSYFPGFGPAKRKDYQEPSMDLESYVPPQDPMSHFPETRFFFYEDRSEILRLEARKVYDQPRGHCVIYVQKSGAVQTRDWDAVGQWFDETVYPPMIRSFGIPSDVDHNGKILLLFYKTEDPRLSGYFSDSDLYDRAVYSGSNQAEILYFNLRERDSLSQLMIDTYPHEFQHLINSSQRLQKGLEEMPRWMDEGLAESAAQWINGDDWLYNQQIWNDLDGAFWSGTSLIQWRGESEDYALSYLFFQYLRSLAEDPSIFRELIENPTSGLTGVIEVMARHDIYWDSEEDLLVSFYLAMALQQQGLYGFGDAPERLGIQPRSPSDEFSPMLEPGAAVYLPLKTPDPSQNLPGHLKWLDTRDYRR